MAITKVTTPVTDFDKATSLPGLKIPSGDNSNQPAGAAAEQGMIRNDTEETVDSSDSALTHYNGTAWQYFAATESVDNPFFASQNFNTVLWDGDGGSSRNITQVGFDPDFVWIKKRQNDTESHRLFDSVRTAGNVIYSDLTNQQVSTSNELNAFITDGFNIGNASAVNDSASGDTYVAWNWKGGGLINESADFNGSSSIQSSISKTALANNFSVSFWWKPDLMNTFQVPMGGLYDETGGIAYGWTVYQGSDNKMYLYWIISSSPNTSNFISNNVVLEKGKWYHVAATKTSTGANIYVNGLSASSSPSQGNIFNIVYNTNPSFYIGKRNVSNNYANGIINQVRVFTSALSSSQVTELYNETAADNSILNYPTSAGCIAAYPLGENANGLDGLYNGTASNVTFGKPGYLTRNTEGTIESTVSANVAAGFSIVGYTGNGSAGATVGHGIDTPELVIIKRLSGVENWAVYSAYSNPTIPQNYLLTLDNTSAAGLNSTRWNNTAPTNAVFSIGTSQAVNANTNTYIAYCWHSVPGYSKIGSYTGNGSTNGPVINLGFEPAWIMIKSTSFSERWVIYDNKRSTSNPRSKVLAPNSNAAEIDTVYYNINFTTTGFTVNGTANFTNKSGETFIYYAIA